MILKEIDEVILIEMDEGIPIEKDGDTVRERWGILI